MTLAIILTVLWFAYAIRRAWRDPDHADAMWWTAAAVLPVSLAILGVLARA